MEVTVHRVPGAAAREAAEFNERWTLPEPDEVTIESLRADWWVPTEFGVEGLGEATDELVGGVPCRVVRPEAAAAVYLHLHGGGWVMGEPRSQDRQLEGIARKCRALVVSVAYRLAPEHPFPAGLDDCVAVAKSLLADPGLAGHRFLVGGESAGANLAVGALLRLRDEGLAGRFVAANLVYGGYSAAPLPSRLAWDRYLVLSPRILEAFEDAYGAGNDPLASPLEADLAGLPPALFTACGEDPLMDDSVLMAARWALAGNEVELDLWPGAPHAVDAFPIALGGLVRRRLGAWLAARATGV